MAYGTPASLGDVEAYYTHIRRGRPPTPEQLADLVRRYEAIGGVSPLAARTEAQRRAIAAALDDAHPDRFRTVVGHKHAEPFVEDAVGLLLADGVDAIVGVVLAPHYSAGSVGQYHERAAATAGATPYLRVDRWHDLDAFVAHQAQAVTRARAALRDGPDDALVLFTAHSLPLRVLDGDPYVDELATGAAAIAARAGLGPRRWRTGWQSAGRTPDPWAGPDLLEVIAGLPGEGERSVVIAPHGFVSEHLEVLYDVDIDAARVAAEAGVTLTRAAVVDDDPAVMAALAGRIAAAAGEADTAGRAGEAGPSGRAGEAGDPAP